MWRVPAAVGMIALGGAGVYWLMVWDAHILILAAFGMVCGSVAGLTLAGRRGLAIGAAVGFIAPLVYLPVWFVFDLPPDVDIDL